MYRCRECGRYYPSKEERCNFCGGKIDTEEKAEKYLRKHNPWSYPSNGKEDVNKQDNGYEENNDHTEENTYEQDDPYQGNPSEKDEYEDEYEDDEALEQVEEPTGFKKVVKIIKNVIEATVCILTVLIGTIALVFSMVPEKYQQKVVVVFKQIEKGAWESKNLNKSGERKGTPKKLIEYEEFEKIIEVLFQKPIAEITWEEIDEIKTVEAIQWVMDGKGQSDKLLKLGLEGKEPLVFGCSASFWWKWRDSRDLSLLHGVEYLDLQSVEDCSFEDLRGMKNLETLKIGKCEGFMEISQLVGFENMHTLSLSDNNVTSLEGIDRLKNLKELELDSVKVESFAPIIKVPQLEVLTLAYIGEPAYIESVGELKGLKKLSLTGSSITDELPLASLSQLQYLKLEGTGIRSIEPLASIPTLVRVELIENNITQLSPLTQLPNLKELKVFENKTSLDIIPQLTTLEIANVNDLSPLVYFKNLEKLSLYNSTNGNSGVLKLLPNLETLEWDNGDDMGFCLEDVSSFFSLPHLKNLTLANGYYTLEQAKTIEKSKLEKLSLKNAQFSRYVQLKLEKDGVITVVAQEDLKSDEILKAIGTMRDLKELEYTYADLKDIGPLGNLSGLEKLSLQDNQIEDLEPLVACQKLTDLNVSSNLVKSIAPITKLGAIRNVRIRGNSIENEADMQLLEARCGVAK